MSDNKPEYYDEGTASVGEFVPTPTAVPQHGPKPVADPEVKIEHGVVYETPFANLLKRQVSDVKECYLVLFEKFLHYKCVAKYTSTDNEMEIEREYDTNFRTTRARHQISDVTMYYNNLEEKWTVNMDFLNSDPLGWYFDSPKQAKKLHDILQNYMVTAL